MHLFGIHLIIISVNILFNIRFLDHKFFLLLLLTINRFRALFKMKENRILLTFFTLTYFY